jgi:hypothetical protein
LEAGEGRVAGSRCGAIKSREMYFAIYQAIAKDKYRSGLYREYPRDFFDLKNTRTMSPGSPRKRARSARAT